METFAINKKNNLINTYGTRPTLPFDVEGSLVEKNAKDIKIEKTIDSKVIQYSLRLKEEVEEKLGENIKIKKEDIVSYEVEEKEESIKNGDQTRKAEEILGELGLEYTEENIRMVEHLLKNGIQITKTNIKSYIKSREYLNKIIDKLDTKASIKLMDRGINIEEENLQKIAESLESMENAKPSKSLGRILKLDRELTYKEAEAIAKEIYGQKMGKDIYDTIMELHKEKLPINKENINKTVEILSKVKNLKTVEEGIYVKILSENKDFNIENLYKENNFYTKTSISKNHEAKDFESFTIVEETNINNLKAVLSDLEIEENHESLNILREFIVQDMEMDREKYDNIVAMKSGLEELLELVDTKRLVGLKNDNANILEEDIFTLIDKLKDQGSVRLEDTNITEEKLEDLRGQLRLLGSIEDKDLLKLIKKGEDFNINSIKEIKERENFEGLNLEEKTLGKTIEISKIFTSLGERLRPSSLALTIRNGESISLENLYLNRGAENLDKVNIEGNKIQINFIQEEYLKLKNTLTTNIIRESIKEGKLVEQMPIVELNKFIEKKINKYKAMDEMARDIGRIKGNEEKIIPLIMKNNLEMTLKEIKEINSFLNGEKALANILKNTVDPKNPNYKEEYKEAIKLLGEKVSNSIKNGDKSFKEDYEDLINILDNPKGESGNTRDNPKKDEYIKIQEKLSKKDMLMQIPINIDGEYKNLNLIVPDANKKVDKNHMNFFLSLYTDNLGLVDMDVEVRGKEVEITMTEENQSIKYRIEALRKSLERIGYSLKEKTESVVN